MLRRSHRRRPTSPRHRDKVSFPFLIAFTPLHLVVVIIHPRRPSLLLSLLSRTYQHTHVAEPQSDTKTDATVKPETSSTTADASKPLAPPPRPAQPQGNNTPDYFTSHLGGSLSLEPNPFEQSFGAPPETPGGTKLPSVAALTSPSALLPGTGVTPFAWGGGSLRTGPLSPAMLSGPTNDYFGDTHHIRGGFPTPNESSMRTGLTPGGSGSMFPAPSPNSQALFAQLASSGATPGTIDFHRTALSAAAAKRDIQAVAPPSVTSQPQEMPNGNPNVKAENKPPTGPFDPHDNDAANGLFMLAQGRNGAPAANNNNYAVQPPQQPAPKSAARAQQQQSTSPQMNGHSIAASSTRGISEAASAMSDESEQQQTRPTTRGRGKRNSTANGATNNGRRKAADDGPKPPAKKSRVNGGGSISSGAGDMDMDHSDDENMNIKDENGNPKTKMTDEEKRKNFLERNRYAQLTPPALHCRVADMSQGRRLEVSPAQEAVAG